MSKPRKKPVVFYDYESCLPVSVGMPALLRPYNHPDTENVSNTRMVQTSVVVAYDDLEGRIETMNTVYLPAQEN